MNIEFLDPKTLQPNPFNSNRVSASNLEKLEKSIRELGFVSAVVVRELPTGLQILGGQHRVEVACKMGLKSVPVLNLGEIDDIKAKKIGLVDNSRYGVDDAIGLAQLYEEIGLSAEELSTFLPFSQQDFESISMAVDIDVDSIGIDMDEDEGPLGERPDRPLKTHDVLKFRVSLGDAEKIRVRIEKTISAERLGDDDDLTAAGSALALLLLGATDE